MKPQLPRIRGGVRLVVPCLAILGTLALAPALFAQESGDTRWWWSASASLHGTRLTCDLCSTERDLGPALGFGIGTFATPSVRVGLDGSYSTSTEGDVRETVHGVGVVVELHPKPGSGLHLIGGLGWAGYRAADFAYDAARLRVGVGWDLPLSSSWVVGNRLTYDASSFASLRSDGETVVRSVGLGTVQLGMYVGKR